MPSSGLEREGGRVGIREVAEAAGVSTTTVSHALSGRGKVSAATADRVRTVAELLGYEPNRLASALRNRRSGVLGFVSDEIATTPFAGRIVLGAQEAASSAGMTLMVVNTGRDPVVEARQIEVLRAQQVDALLYATMFHRITPAPRGFASGPVVMVNSSDPDGRSASIVPDERRIGREATALLLEAGHRRIVHLTIDEAVPAVEGRSAGHREAMVGAGLEPVVVAVEGPGDAAAGRRAMVRALAAHPDLTAVFVFNDPMSMGVYQDAFHRGRSVPGDLSVVSVDDLELISAQLLPGLTTFELPHYEMGSWAVEQAVNLIGEPGRAASSVSARCRLVRRGSVARPRD